MSHMSAQQQSTVVTIAMIAINCFTNDCTAAPVFSEHSELSEHSTYII